MKKFFWGFFFILVILALFLFLTIQNTKRSPIEDNFENQENKEKTQQTQEKECLEGEVKNCTYQNCPGKMICEGGKFSSCVIAQKICKSGDKVGCLIDGCKFGYRICNECGQYGECIIKEKLENCSG